MSINSDNLGRYIFQKYKTSLVPVRVHFIATDYALDQHRPVRLLNLLLIPWYFNGRLGFWYLLPVQHDLQHRINLAINNVAIQL
jgi:hypothetical protein